MDTSEWAPEAVLKLLERMGKGARRKRRSILKALPAWIQDGYAAGTINADEVLKWTNFVFNKANVYTNSTTRDGTFAQIRDSVLNVLDRCGGKCELTALPLNLTTDDVTHPLYPNLAHAHGGDRLAYKIFARYAYTMKGSLSPGWFSRLVGHIVASRDDVIVEKISDEELRGFF